MHPLPRALLLAFIVACIVALASMHGHASGAVEETRPLILEAGTHGQRADGHLSVLRDARGDWTLAEVRGMPFSTLSGQPGFGFTQEAIWLRLDLDPGAEARPWWLEVAFPSLDDIRLFVPDGQGGYVEQRAGDRRPFAERPVRHRHFVFPVDLPGPGTHSVYLRIQTADSLIAPIRLWAPEEFRARMEVENLWLGIGYGIILAMLIYNAFLWRALRDRLYGLYILSGLTALLVIVELNGHAFQYLWPENLWLADHQHVLLPAAHFITVTTWARAFLDTPRHAPRFDVLLRMVIAGALVMIGLSIAGQYSLGNQLAFWIGMPMTVLLLIVTARIAVAGFRPARLFLLAQLPPLLGALVTTSRALGWIPDLILTEHALHIGIGLEVLLFSLALAQRIHLLREEKRLAQARAETDPLTGLCNRAGLFDHIEREIGQQSPFALLLVDLDGFKPVNDRLGHAAGDAVLTEVAHRLRATVRAEGDRVARLGGDEFVLVLRGMRACAGAGAVADKILAALRAPFTTPAGEARIGASLGIALFPGNGRDLASLLHAADQAMYAAKRAGRDRWHCRDNAADMDSTSTTGG